LGPGRENPKASASLPIVLNEKQTASVVSAVLSDFETATIEVPLRATLRMLCKLTREHALNADDMREVLAAGVSREQIEDAIAPSGYAPSATAVCAFVHHSHLFVFAGEAATVAGERSIPRCRLRSTHQKESCR
jgi:hypothetical protein